jgi:hypothetical protein
MERLDFRRTSSTALVAELRRHAGLDEAAVAGGSDRSPFDREPAPWAGLAAQARVTLDRLIPRHGAGRLRHSASRLPRGERA